MFVDKKDQQQMSKLVSLLNRVLISDDYRQLAGLALVNQSDRNQTLAGVFYGYDFHLSDNGPQLIEINTNAGGGALVALMSKTAITSCCGSKKNQNLMAMYLDMFTNEWQRFNKHQNQQSPLKSIAIIDEDPTEQFLYPEFLLFKQYFEKQGISVVITAPEDLSFVDQNLKCGDQIIDLVYNRSTDFDLSAPHSFALKQAFEQNTTAITPNPIHHDVYANKNHLVNLSDHKFIQQLNLSDDDKTLIQQGIPKTLPLNSTNQDELWASKKQWFFKPANGYGSKATYRGDKITKAKFNELINMNGLAQELVKPNTRANKDNGTMKMDIRTFSYKGDIQTIAARLYQGQTTNFRTNGGGFAPVIIV